MKKFLLTLITAVCIGFGVNAKDVTITFSELGYANAAAVDSITTGDENISVVCAKSNGSNVPAYYTSGSALRIYANNTMTISAVGSNKITKIVFTATGASNIVNTDMSNVGTITKSSSISTWTGDANKIVITNTGSAQIRLTKMVISYETAEAKAVEDVKIDYAIGSDGYADVTLSCATEGADIFYGDEENSITTKYTAPFKVKKSCTIYAQATKGSDKSNVTSKAITLTEVYSNLKDLVASTSNEPVVAVGNFEVIYQQGKYAIFTDGTSNALLYVITNSGNEAYEVGTKFTKVKGTISQYNGLFELVNYEIEDGGTGAAEPQALTSLSDLSIANNIFDKVIVSGASISGVNGNEATLTLGDETQKLYNAFSLDSEMFADNTDVTVTGFVWCYKNAICIAPIEIKESHPKTDPNLSFTQAELEFDLADGKTEVDGLLVAAPEGVEVSYTSSNEAVVKVTADGNKLTLIGKGTATITATSVANDVYKAGKASYDVKVTDSNCTEDEFVFNGDSDDVFSTVTGVVATFKAEKGTGTQPKYYFNGTALRVYKNNTLSFSVSEGYHIVSIEMVGNYSNNNLSNVSFNEEHGAFSLSDDNLNGVFTAKGDKLTSTEASVTATTRITKITVKYAANAPAKKNPELSFDEAEVTVDLADGEDYTIQPLTCPDGLDITYESDEEGVVLIVGEEAVLMGTGTATITAKSAETLEYEAGEASYKVIVIDSRKKVISMRWSEETYEVMEGTEDPENVPTLIIEDRESLEGLVIEYTSSDEKVAEYDEDFLAAYKPGTAKITAKATAKGGYEGSASFTVTVTEAPKLGAITVNGQTADENGDFDITICRGDEITISAENAVSISYVDTDTDDSKTVEGYKATFSLNKKGVFIYEITVTPYVGEPTRAYLMVTVTNRNPKTDTYEKVTSDEQIVAGAEYVILSVPTNSGTALYGPFAMTTPKSNGKGFDSVVLEAYAEELKPSYEITNTEVAIFTLEAAAGGEWYFKAEGGYLYASSDKLLGYSDENKTAMNIEAGDAETAISFGDYKLLCSPANASTGVPGTITFNNYTSNMKPVILYKRVVNIDSEKLTPVLNDETLTVEKNNEGGFDIKIYHDAEYDDVTIHYLHTKAAQVAGRRAVDHGAFARAYSEDGVTHTFSVDGAGKVEYYGYHAGTDTKGIVNSFIINENGTTSIESIMLDGVDPEACYDLQGRRVVRPVRGLFISNGRKVYVR